MPTNAPLVLIRAVQRVARSEPAFPRGWVPSFLQTPPAGSSMMAVGPSSPLLGCGHGNSPSCMSPGAAADRAHGRGMSTHADRPHEGQQPSASKPPLGSASASATASATSRISSQGPSFGLAGDAFQVTLSMDLLNGDHCILPVSADRYSFSVRGVRE